MKKILITVKKFRVQKTKIPVATTGILVMAQYLSFFVSTASNCMKNSENLKNSKFTSFVQKSKENKYKIFLCQLRDTSFPDVEWTANTCFQVADQKNFFLISRYRGAEKLSR